MTNVTEDPPIISDDAIQMWMDKPKNGHASPVVNINWCTAPLLEDELKELGAIDPQIVLITLHNQAEVDRFVFPLRAMKAQIHFRYPGQNHVYALVVWRSDEVKHPEKLLKERANGGAFRVPVLEWRSDVLDQMLDDMQVLERQLRNAQRRIELENDKLVRDRDYPEAPADEADETAQRVYHLECQIIDHKNEIRRLQMNGEPDQEVIAAAEAEIADINQRISHQRRQISDYQPTAVYTPRPVKKIAATQDWHSKAVTHARNTGIEPFKVDARLFGKSWWITTKLGTLFPWPTKAVIQCQMRRRAFLTAGVMLPFGIFLAAVWLMTSIFRFVGALVLTFLGMRDIDYMLVVKPFSKSLKHWLKESEQTSHQRTSVWYYRIDKHGNPKRRHFAFAFLNPPVMVVFAIVGYFVYSQTGNIWWLILGLTGGLLLAGLAFFATSVLGSWLGDKMDQLEAWLDKLEDASRKKALQQTERDLRELSCNLVLERPTSGIKALPRANRVQYVYGQAKKKVCRPYPG